DSITEKMSRVLKTRDDMIEFYGYLDTSYARSWKTEGYIIGRLLYCQYMFDIVFSASITQLGGDYQIQKGKKYRIELNASNGALIICTHIFETDGVINFFRIPGGMNNSSGYGAMAKFNDSLILVAGGGAGGTSGENPVSYGGGGYNGGYGTYPGLSYNGELGNSTEQNPNGGGRYNPSPTVGYGGTGYVHADLVNDTTIINVGDTDLINHSQNTGYVGSYVRLIEMI
ncbi:MAG: hypothetical protein J5706_04595, partial [Elusimicrobiales bacterium]|nr:hypothetical protein [Elusimicrobiales bacterium]